LDYSVEGANNQAALEHTCTEIIHTIARAKADANISFAVFKITGVAPFEILEKISANTQLTTHENTQWQQAVQRVHRICAEAAAVQQPVFIDAEETWIQPAIDALATEMMQKFNKNAPLIYNTIQLYRHDRLQYLYQTHAHATANGYYLGVKLVRGAYMEKERTRAQNLGYPSPIQPTKAATDHDYDLALHFCIDNIKNTALCAGTHNEQSTQLLINAMAKNNLPPNHPHICFSQLYGMSDNLSYNLTNAHYNVSKYLPYGPISAVLPYLIRRANENTAMAGQMSRELNLIIQERKRRNIA
jgi:proline dehydrogenase